MSSESILERKPPAADLRLTYGPDQNHFADVRIPKGNGPYPVVFFLHGGYWRGRYDLAHAGHLCHALRQAGIAAWNVEYRRVGQTGGGWPGTFEDVRAAFKALHENSRAQHLDLNRLCVAGHSAGGQLALCLAAHEKSIKRVVSLAGVLDLRRAWELHLSNNAVLEFLGGSPQQVPEHYREASPAEQDIHAVQKLVHGTNDGDVPYEIAKSYAERKMKAGERVELTTLPGIGHFEIVDPESAVWERILGIFVSSTR